MSIRLFVSRHGETEYNRKGLLQGRGIDAPLNETGKRQAEQLAGYLKNYKADMIVSSSMKRAEETALFYCNGTPKKLIKCSALDEMDFGNYEGVLYEEAANDLKQLDRSWRKGEVELPIPGGESPSLVFQRANEEVQQLLKKLKTGTLMVFVHGRLIRILLSEWLGFGLKNMHKIEHQNGAVNKLIFENGRFEPVYLNKTDHLI